MSYQGFIDRRVRSLEQEQGQRGAHEHDNTWYEFIAATSCPPDKRIQIRGGTVTPSSRWGFIINQSLIPDWICDFEDTEETGLALSFANANYYLPFILAYFGDWVSYRSIRDEPIVFDNVVGTEVETAAEAEAQIDAFLNGYTNWYNYRFPLWGVVLRNNGTIDLDVQILAVDPVNRGRSYLYRDARARNCLIE